METNANKPDAARLARMLMDHAEVTIDCLSEDMPVRGNTLASGDPEEDRAQEDEILAQLDAGNEWAWCCVRVTATWEGFKGVAYLGCCSYSDEASFMVGGYAEDMTNEAFADLAASILNSHERTERTLALAGVSL